MVQWRNIAAATGGLLAVGARAQTGTLLDLGSLLESQKNLSTFNTLIQVCRVIVLACAISCVGCASGDAIRKAR